jgi:hypothetical protein
MVLWWGVFITCTSGLSGAQFASVASPLFVMTLLLFVSGIPLQVGGAGWGAGRRGAGGPAAGRAPPLLPRDPPAPPRPPHTQPPYTPTPPVPPLPLRAQEAQAKRRWGDTPEYQAYRERTNLLVPLPKPAACCPKSQ